MSVADIRCPSCGHDNPDFLDLCQFCQTPLKPESMVQIGEGPTKKDTGELEPILPDWLKELRQQARQSAEEDAASDASAAKAAQEDAPDLLAGLASQSDAEDDEIPEWLAGIAPAGKVKPQPSPPSTPAQDFFSQFDQPASESSEPESVTPSREDSGAEAGMGGESDELSTWFSRASEQPSTPFTVEPGEFTEEALTPGSLEASGVSGESAAPEEPEDLSWLRDLEASAKQADERPVSAPEPGMPAADVPAESSEADLSWLDELGGFTDASEAAPPGASIDEGTTRGTSPQPPEAVLPDEPASSGEDLNWLQDLGSVAETSEAQPEKPSSAEDLDWLRDLGTTSSASEQAELPAAQDAAEPSESRDEEADPPAVSSPMYSPRRTAPLSEAADIDSVPEWLRSATEQSSMPPLGAGALDWYASHAMEEEEAEKAEPRSEKASPPSAGKPVEPVVASTPPESKSSAEVESLLSADLPDWLSQPESGDMALGESPVRVSREDESLAPVDLPSWVQAMRPVEAAISETAAGAEDQEPETEGPLAGISGVIPLAPISTSPRPKAISLKLQPTTEQQTSAALLEEMLAGETTPRPLVTSSLRMPQRELRWAITALVLIVLGAMAALGSQAMPVPASLPIEVSNISNTIGSISAGSPVLVVIDYEPGLAAELEAAGGPLLDQLARLRQVQFTLLSTSPNGPALGERLLANTGITRPAPDGLGYERDQGYFNLGYLPGGSAGLLAFIQSPQTAVPAATVAAFSDFGVVVVVTDHAESARLWVEQLDARSGAAPNDVGQPLLVVASAQAAPMLRPYVSSGQVDGMISGIPDAARFEFVNNVPTRAARTYWDAFGTGLLLAVILITFGSVWSVLMRIRSGAEQG